MEVAALDVGGVARRLFGDLAYRSGRLREELAEAGVVLPAERADRRPAIRQQVEVCFAAFNVLSLLASHLALPVSRYTQMIEGGVP